jgi:PhzF family phenazine biosynthesis protein
MGLKIYQVDAFTDKPFGGNPAGVCMLESELPAKWMQSFAAEMNLAETAFLLPEEGGYHLRWFTPKVEVDLCGHATLGASHVLWEQGYLSADKEAHYTSRSGVLTAKKNGAWIALNFPTAEVTPIQAPEDLLPGLHLSKALFIGTDKTDILVELESEEQVRTLEPDIARLSKISGTRGIIVTSRATTAGYDFISRFFAPAVGINEDPVTGSMHCGLTWYWSGKLGKKDLMSYQASARGGVLRVHLKGPRVEIEGQACTVFKGELI